MATTHHPIEPHEADALFAPFARAAERSCALAVSGGADSTALMVLFAEWLRRNGVGTMHHTVLTVDHGLRPTSASEACAVASQSEQLGLRHAVLAWSEAKPKSGIQAAARTARYRLIAQHMSANGIFALFTAHTRDDQAETLLMRLARGSGVDGLSAMAPVAYVGGELTFNSESSKGLQILRPFLPVPKERLAATLASRGIGWIEDPSNEAIEFERVRLRSARTALEKLGLTNEMLALSATRLGRVRAALDAATVRFLAPAQGNLAVTPLGRITIDRHKLRAAGEEIALRAIRRAIAAAGGYEQPAALSKVEAIVAGLVNGNDLDSRAWTLARAKITVDGREIVVEREPGRTPLPHLCLARGTEALWDGRFIVRASVELPEDRIEVRPLGDAALGGLRRDDPLIAAAPFGPATLAPSFWVGDALLAVPPLQHWREPAYRALLRADFIGTGLGDGEGAPC